MPDKTLGQVAYEVYQSKWSELEEGQEHPYPAVLERVAQSVLSAAQLRAVEQAGVAGPTWELIEACEKALRNALPLVRKDYEEERESRIELRAALALIADAKRRR